MHELPEGQAIVAAAERQVDDRPVSASGGLGGLGADFITQASD